MARSERALLPPSHVPQLRAAKAVAYDGEVAASLFPITTPSLLAYDKLRRLATWSPFGHAYDDQRCKRNLSNSETRTSSMSGSGYSETEISKASREVPGLFADRVCSMRETLSNACVVAQQEVEVAASNIAYLAQALLVNEEECAVATASEPLKPKHLTETPLVKFLSDLCKSQPNKCATLVALLEDIASLAELRDRNASVRDYQQRPLSSAGLRLLKNPNALCMYRVTQCFY